MSINNRPNVLFIVTDDQRYDTIHALGNEEILTPNLDQLVLNGTCCMNAYIPGGLTGAVCMPSRAMINTGRGLYEIQDHGQSVPASHTLLGEHFRNNGYHAFGTGKWHNGPPAFTRSFDEGENAFFSGMWDHWNVPTCRHDPTGKYDNVVNFTMDFYHNKNVSKIHCDSIQPGVHSSELVANATVDFINSYQGEKPFYCYTAFLAPHDPRTMPQEYLDMYRDRVVTIPDNFQETYPFSYAEGTIRDEVLIPYPRTYEQVRSEITDYYAMITHLDHEIGRIIDALKESGKYDDTLIVLCGDNGLGMGSHAFMGKQNHFEHSIKVPLLFKGPGIDEGKRIVSKVYLHDIFPTLCDLIGISIPPSVTATSFARCLRHDTGHRQSLYYSYGASARSIRHGDYKLMEYISEDGIRSSLLFDVVNDPLELHDLSNSQPKLMSDMRQRLLEMKNTIDDLDRLESQRFWSRY